MTWSGAGTIPSPLMAISSTRAIIVLAESGLSTCWGLEFHIGRKEGWKERKHESDETGIFHVGERWFTLPYSVTHDVEAPIKVEVDVWSHLIRLRAHPAAYNGQSASTFPR